MVIQDPEAAQIGEEILPFEMGYLPEFFKKKAELELHETPEKLVQCNRRLKEMIKLDKKLMNIDITDDFLLQHLRTRKFNVERALLSLKTFVSFTRKTPESYTNFKFEEIVKTFEDKFISILPWRCQDGSTLVLAELGNWRTNNVTLDDLKRTLALIFLLALRDPMTQVNGFKIIFNVESSSLRYLKFLTPHNVYLLYHGLQECVPGRFKGIHIVKDSLTFKTGWLIIKHLLSDKFRSRFHFHSSKKTLLDFFPRAVLPVSYGGEVEDYDQSAWLKRAMTPEELDKVGGGALRDLCT